MALSNFFNINLPYGIKRNEDGHWAAFNREYKPLGQNNPWKTVSESDFVYTNYGELSDKFLIDLADDPTSFQRDENKVIVKVFFYNDTTNPSNRSKEGLWEKYFEKLRLVSAKRAL